MNRIGQTLAAVATLLLAYSTVAAQEIHEAAARGDVVTMRALLDRDPRLVYQTDSLGAAPLHFAALSGSKHAVDLLIAASAGVDVRDHYGTTPLHWAMRAGPRFGVTNPMMLGLSEIETGTKGRDSADMELELPWYNVAMVLIQRGADINAQDNFGATPLHRAAGSPRTTLARLLVQQGADTDVQDRTGKTPLHWAARVGNGQIAMVLIRGNANINLRDNEGRLALHDAVTFNKWDFARQLLRNGAEVNIRDAAGRTPLRIAMQERDDKMIELLQLNNAVE